MPPAARNPSNQGILDYLTTLSQHEKFNKPSSHYPFIFQKALRSIADEITPITTYEQAKKVRAPQLHHHHSEKKPFITK
jgi:hypothetical protein